MRLATFPASSVPPSARGVHAVPSVRDRRRLSARPPKPNDRISQRIGPAIRPIRGVPGRDGGNSLRLPDVTNEAKTTSVIGTSRESLPGGLSPWIVLQSNDFEREPLRPHGRRRFE